MSRAYVDIDARIPAPPSSSLPFPFPGFPGRWGHADPPVGGAAVRCRGRDGALIANYGVMADQRGRALCRVGSSALYKAL